MSNPSIQVSYLTKRPQCTSFHLYEDFSILDSITKNRDCIYLIDQNVYTHFEQLFYQKKIIILPFGEAYKNIETVINICQQLKNHSAQKSSLLIGIGGGVTTDLVGFVASIFMRGVDFGFAPTSLLSMIDAALGGKNGVNMDHTKNMLGLINQPQFLWYDLQFLKTLPEEEWVSGSAEIIKYACILDFPFFNTLQKHKLSNLINDSSFLKYCVSLCIQHKINIVKQDEDDTNIRKILNFGHTVGHSFESLYKLSHGQAIAYGMIVAIIASETHLSLDKNIRLSFCQLIKQYGLSTHLNFNIDTVMNQIFFDKKRNNKTIDFILLKAIGEATIVPLQICEIKDALQIFANEYKN